MQCYTMNIDFNKKNYSITNIQCNTMNIMMKCNIDKQLKNCQISINFDTFTVCQNINLLASSTFEDKLELKKNSLQLS